MHASSRLFARRTPHFPAPQCTARGQINKANIHIELPSFYSTGLHSLSPRCRQGAGQGRIHVIRFHSYRLWVCLVYITKWNIMGRFCTYHSSLSVWLKNKSRMEPFLKADIRGTSPFIAGQTGGPARPGTRHARHGPRAARPTKGTFLFVSCWDGTRASIVGWTRARWHDCGTLARHRHVRPTKKGTK